MHREAHKTMDIFCYAVFVLIFTASLCNADEGNRKGGNDNFSITAFVKALPLIFSCKQKPEFFSLSKKLYFQKI